MSAIDKYRANRKKLLDMEYQQYLGSSSVLSDLEKRVDVIIMRHKTEELDKAFKHPEEFPSAMHFFKSKKLIEESPIFRIIKAMPKGACLHVHDTSMTSLEYLTSLLDISNLYGRIKDEGVNFRVMAEHEATKEKWLPIKELKRNVENFDEFIISQLSLISPDPKKESQRIISDRLVKCLATLDGIICHRAIFEQHFYNGLKEFYDDNVRYLEFRGLLPEVYETNGSVYNPVETVEIYLKVLKKFKQDYPDFIGAKLIYAPVRHCSKEFFSNYIKLALTLKEVFPDFIAGFDLSGREEFGPPLYEFVPELLKLNKKLNLYLHAGQTNWNGSETDLNILDAILLNPKRIGHALSIIKHPEAMKMVLDQDIAIELCPISNQVLKMVDDLRNHPAAILLNSGFPVVIGCDHASMWGTKGLSYDFYIIFMGVANRNCGLKFLKQLALNSIEYSALDRTGKDNAMMNWVSDWNKFLSHIINKFGYPQNV